jgi:hypothetical protein
LLHDIVFTAVPPISRLIVEGALDNLTAMSLMLRFATNALDISSFHQAKALTKPLSDRGRYPPVWWIVA